MVDLLCSGSHAYRSWRGRTSLELVSIYGIRTNSIQVVSRGVAFSWSSDSVVVSDSPVTLATAYGYAGLASTDVQPAAGLW